MHPDVGLFLAALLAICSLWLAILSRGYERWCAALLGLGASGGFLLDPMASVGCSMYPSSHGRSLVVTMPFAYGLRIPFTTKWVLRWASPADGEVVITMRDPSLANVMLHKRVCNTASELLAEHLLNPEQIDATLAALEADLARHDHSDAWVNRVISLPDWPEGSVRAGMAIRTVRTGTVTHQVLWSQAAAIDEQILESVRRQRAANQTVLCGDNRILSADSRTFAAIDQDLVYARQWFVIGLGSQN